MEFAILGPLVVRRDGERVAVPGRHHPRLLAALLTDPGRAVTMDRLVEILWEDQPPATARRQVQNALATLRRGFGSAAAVIATTDTGYRLDVEPDDVDAIRFARLTERAGALRKRGDRPAALRQLREALALWRGDAFTGVTGRLIDGAAMRLNDARIAAIEDRVELELDLGATEAAVGELRQLLDRHPLRQRTAALLMTALRHAGRVPEALEVYTRTRAELGRALGAQPDSRLVELNRELLRSQRSPQPRTPSKPSVPAQLPAAARTFTGRVEHLALLDAMLDYGGTAVVSAIAGMGGAGKTALAVHWAHRVRDCFPDGQLYLNLRGYGAAEPVTPFEALTRLLRTLGVQAESIPADMDSAARLFRSLISNRRALIVLDNALDATQLRPLLPGRFAGVVLATSRDRLAELSDIDGATTLRLDTLREEEAVELLNQLVGTARVRREPAAARDLTRLCGGLPLALRIAAAQLGAAPKRELADLVAELSEQRGLDRLTVEDEPAVAVAATLDASLRRLAHDSRRLFLALGLLPGDDFSGDLARHCSGLDVDSAHDALSALVDAHLVENHRPDRYRFHDLVKQYARDNADSAFDPAARDRLRTETIAWHTRRHGELPIDEVDNVVAMGRAWTDEPGSWRLVSCFRSFVRNVRALPSYLELAERLAQGFAADTRIPEASWFHAAMSALYRATGDRRRALEHARAASDIAELSPDGDPVGTYVNAVGLCISELGQYAECLPYFRIALDRAVRAEAVPQIINTSTSIADLELRRGDLATAERAIRAALDAASTQSAQARTYLPNMALAGIQRIQGHYPAAVAELSKSLEWAKRTGKLRHEILCRLFRGETRLRAGELTAAESDLLEAIDLATQSGRDTMLLEARLRLAEVRIGQNRLPQALELLDLIEPEPPYEDDSVVAAEYLLAMAKLHNAAGRHLEAVDSGERSYTLLCAIPDLVLQVRALAELAVAYEALGRTETALARRTEAQHLRDRLGIVSEPEPAV